MDWKNINLSSGFERDQPIIDSLSFHTLLLKVNCNLRELNEETILKQFEEDLQNRIVSAREVMKNNLENLLKEAIRERKTP